MGIDERTDTLVKDIELIVRPGRQVANAFQGKVPRGVVGQIVRSPKSVPPEKVLLRLRSVFQADRKVQEVVVPHLSAFLRLISVDEPIFYKGVSFNPLVATFGENVNILDFFSWVKKANVGSVVLDASLYAIVNAARQSPAEKFSREAAKDTVRFLNTKRKEHPLIEKAAEIREKYLRAIAVSLFAPREAPLVVSAAELWSGRKYAGCLQRAIEFCAEKPGEGEALEIARYADYERYGARYQRWYTVLVLAEVLYLNLIYGVNVKVGPTSESNFDSVINDFMAELAIPFAFVWYNREIEKQIPYPDRLSFGDAAREVRKKLACPVLEEWMREILEPFKKEGEDTVTASTRIIRRINRAAEKDLPRLAGERGSRFFRRGERD